MYKKHLQVPLAVLLTLVIVMGLFTPALAKVGRTVDVQILAINDFHGALEPPTGSGGRVGSTPVNAGGGVEYLATHIQNRTLTNPNTLFLSGGDMVGASPLISALFHDEPTIEALNLMGMDASAVGNHEFDEGWVELLRMQYGGCHPEDGCLDGDPFYGADFKFLTANVFKSMDGKRLFPPYKIFNFNGARVGVIGVSLSTTPTIVTPSGVEGLDFRAEAEYINKAAKELTKRRVKTIVVLIHEGGYQSGLYNECVSLTGPIVDIVKNTSKDIDAFITGHTHSAFNCVVEGRLVTAAMSSGRVLTDIDLTIDKSTGDVVKKSAENIIVTRDVMKDPEMTALIDKYKTVSGPIAGRVIGETTAPITRTATPAGESALGDVIADAQLWYTMAEANGGAVIAFMNPGGIRADLPVGTVTYGDAFTVQPFANNLVTMTLTGAQIKVILEQQQFPGRILQVSEGFTYSWSESAPAGSKISDMMLNGVPLDMAASYRVTENIFLADGGDNFLGFKAGTDRMVGDMDLDALIAYFGEFSPVAPGLQNRITKLP
jgi:5'-nucleotidase